MASSRTATDVAEHPRVRTQAELASQDRLTVCSKTASALSTMLMGADHGLLEDSGRDVAERHHVGRAPTMVRGLGMPYTARGRVRFVLVMVRPPRLRKASNPRAPSEPMPVMTTPTPAAPHRSATESNSSSAEGRWIVGGAKFQPRSDPGHPVGDEGCRVRCRRGLGTQRLAVVARWDG